MPELNKKDLSERDICTKFITPLKAQSHQTSILGAQLLDSTLHHLFAA